MLIPPSWITANPYFTTAAAGLNGTEQRAVPSVTITAMPKRGAVVEQSGIYWCSVCKLPVRLNQGDVFPECANMCARGGWEPVQLEETAAEGK